LEAADGRKSYQTVINQALRDHVLRDRWRLILRSAWLCVSCISPASKPAMIELTISINSIVQRQSGSLDTQIQFPHDHPQGFDIIFARFLDDGSADGTDAQSPDQRQLGRRPACTNTGLQPIKSFVKGSRRVILSRSEVLPVLLLILPTLFPAFGLLPRPWSR
jgi:hypothetical protein